jgi:hypothetical protein
MKRDFKRRLDRAARRLRKWWMRPLVQAQQSLLTDYLGLNSSGIAQVQLANEWTRRVREGVPLPDFREAGFRVFSEGDEDGILLLLFAALGAPTRTLVDVGAGWLRGSNSANLLLHHGWDGVLIEAVPERARELDEAFRSRPDTDLFPPRVLAARVTRDDVNDKIRAGLGGRDADLLCIDIDGLDYWIWQAISCIRPRVVLIEYLPIWGPELSLTVPYRDDFEPVYAGRFGIYGGASLAALVKLGRQKGYRLVGCQRYGYNAFFVRDDLGAALFPEVSAASCFAHPYTAWMRDAFLEQTRAREWIEV